MYIADINSPTVFKFNELPKELRLQILDVILGPLQKPANIYFYHPKQIRRLHISIHRRERSINDKLGRLGNYHMTMDVSWVDSRDDELKEEKLCLQNVRTVAHVSRLMRQEIAELCWTNILLEISDGDFLATLQFLVHRESELRCPLSIFMNLRLHFNKLLDLKAESIHLSTENLENPHSLGFDLASTFGMVELLDRLRTHFRITYFNLWISMTVEGAQILLREQPPRTWVNAFRLLPVEKAMCFWVSVPDGYDEARKKHVLALVMSLLMPNRIRERLNAKYAQVVNGDRVETEDYDVIDSWVVEELKAWTVGNPLWTPSWS